MKTKTNEGINYWYEKAASDFLEADVEMEEANILHDDFAITKEQKENFGGGYFD